MTSRPSAAAPILAALAILAAFVGAYAGGYFLLGEQSIVLTEIELPSAPDAPPNYSIQQTGIDRAYPQLWLMMIYQPAGRLEAWLSGSEVQISWDGKTE